MGGERGSYERLESVPRWPRDGTCQEVFYQVLSVKSHSVKGGEHGGGGRNVQYCTLVYTSGGSGGKIWPTPKHV